MAITAELHDGTQLEFPDGTDPAVIQRTVKRVLAEAKAAPPGKSDAQKIGARSPSLGVTAAQGPLFGFGDEIAGAVTATLKGIPGLDSGAEGTTWGQRYKGYRDVLRGQEDAYREENPYTATGVQVLASVPTMAVTGPVAAGVKGVGIGANALRAGLTGAASGAISGAGNSQANALSDVALDAVKGGAFGGVAGGTVTPAAAVAGKIFKTGASAASTKVARDYAREKVAQQFSRDNVTATQAANNCAHWGLTRPWRLLGAMQCWGNLTRWLPCLGRQKQMLSR